MSQERYNRFAIPKPEHLGDAHWGAIEIEVTRFVTALDTGDDSQALGQLKCIVEALAKVVWDLNGEPAAANQGIQPLVRRAHDLLARQPGRELTNDSPYSALAAQARKMAEQLGEIRNSHGSGHGRPRQPVLRDEMLDLTMDGALMWTRWALRRIDHFAYGRPETLIRDLIGDPYGQKTFSSGNLADRLRDANLSDIEARHARAIGVAVGQRTARETFVVAQDGVEQPINDGGLERWPAPYRLGVATGLLFAPDESPTITAYNLLRAAQICEPVRDAPEEIANLLSRTTAVLTQGRPSRLPGSAEQHTQLRWLVGRALTNCPASERAAWQELAHVPAYILDSPPSA